MGVIRVARSAQLFAMMLAGKVIRIAQARLIQARMIGDHAGDELVTCEMLAGNGAHAAGRVLNLLYGRSTRAGHGYIRSSRPDSSSA